MADLEIYGEEIGYRSPPRFTTSFRFQFVIYTQSYFSGSLDLSCNSLVGVSVCIMCFSVSALRVQAVLKQQTSHQSTPQ